MGTDKTKHAKQKSSQRVSIDKNTIISVAKQAKLTLTDIEIETFSRDIAEILKTFSVLDEVDVKNTLPSFRPIEERNHMREDVVKPSISQADALQFTEDSQDGYFIGPRTVNDK